MSEERDTIMDEIMRLEGEVKAEFAQACKARRAIIGLPLHTPRHLAELDDVKLLDGFTGIVNAATAVRAKQRRIAELRAKL